MGDTQELVVAEGFSNDGTSPTRRCCGVVEALDDNRVTLDDEAKPATPKEGLACIGST